MSRDKKVIEILEAFKYALELVENTEEVKREIDTLTLKRSDIQLDLNKAKKKADQELANHKESVGIEMNTLTTQLNNMNGELNRLPAQITSKKDSITALDEVIDGLKIEQEKLEDSNKRLKEINDGMKAGAKAFSAKLSEA